MSEERRSHNLQMAEDIGYMKGLLEGIAGPDGRITQLEHASTRNWWVTYVVTPLLFLASATARHFGVKI